jgi:hypothetical protein
MVDNESNPEISSKSNENQYNLQEAKEAIKGSRDIKEYANLIELDSRGRADKKIEDIIDQTNNIAGDMYDQNKEWVDGHLEKLQGLFPDASTEDIKSAYFSGLDRFIKRQYKVYKKDEPSELSTLEDRQYLRDTIFAFTFDYILLARLTHRKTSSSKTALQIATNASMLSPEDYKNLVTNYSQLGEGAINAAATDRPLNPEKFLDGIIESIERLKYNKKYADLGDRALKEAVINRPTNPEKYLDNALSTITRLRTDDRYDSLGDSTIKTAAINYPTNPEKFLNNVISSVGRLKRNEKYAGLGEGAINIATVSYPTNPEKFLDGVIVSIERLKSNEKYTGLGDNAINVAAISHSTDPEKFLEGVIVSIERLKNNERYAGFGDSEIYTAAIGHPSNPESYLERKHLDKEM